MSHCPRSGLKSSEVVDCAARPGRRQKDCPRVAAKNPDPVAHIGRMVGPRRVGDPEIGTEECRSNFGDKFFHGVSVITKPGTEIPIETLFMPCPMCQLMKLRRIVGFGCTAGGSAGEE